MHKICFISLPQDFLHSLASYMKSTCVLINGSTLTFIFLIGVPVGYFSSSLKELQGTLDDSAGSLYKWLELSPANSTVRFLLVIILVHPYCY